MTTSFSNLWDRLLRDKELEGLLRLAMLNVSYKLSDLVNRPIKLNSLRLETVSLNELIGDNPEAETVGVYLRSSDNLPSQTILMLSLDDAMYMADWLLEARPGTTTKLGPLEYSALAETGNLALAAFLTTIAEYNQNPLRLSPPAVVVDMLATILELVTTWVTAVTDDLLIIKADFEVINDSLKIQFWVLPDPIALEEDLQGSKTVEA